MKKKHILIVGAGQLGSRYLQGLDSCPVPLDIMVIDTCIQSLGTARSRWEQVASEEAPHRVSFSKDYGAVPGLVDLCLVPTTADVRLAVVEQIVSKTNVRFWVLEKVLAQSIKQIDHLEHCFSDSDGVWINTPRRMMSWHQQIRNVLPSGESWKVFLGGKSWEMACNSIHFLDLIAWFTGESLVSIQTSGLQNWIPSKRNGFLEVTGQLIANFSGGTELILESDNTSEPFVIRLKNSEGEWVLEESIGSFKGPDGFSLPGKVELQSEMSGCLVDGILNNVNCALTTFKESAAIHRIFLQSLLEHWNTSQNSNEFLLPIT